MLNVHTCARIHLLTAWEVSSRMLTSKTLNITGNYPAIHVTRERFMDKIPMAITDTYSEYVLHNFRKTQ